MIKKIRKFNFIVATISGIICMWYTVICRILDPTIAIEDLQFSEITLLITFSSLVTGSILWFWEQNFE